MLFTLYCSEKSGERSLDLSALTLCTDAKIRNDRGLSVSNSSGLVCTRRNGRKGTSIKIIPPKLSRDLVVYPVNRTEHNHGSIRRYALYTLMPSRYDCTVPAQPWGRGHTECHARSVYRSIMGHLRGSSNPQPDAESLRAKPTKVRQVPD